MKPDIPILALAFVLISFCAGCGANYGWRPSVPVEMRSVTVPTLRNETDVVELGAVAARQILREVQREGTFGIRPSEEAALEIQGVVKSAAIGATAYDRRSGMRAVSGEYAARVEISVIDRRAHKVLVDNRVYTARTMVTAEQDWLTAQRDASGRLMDDLARQVVDDLLNFKW